MKWPIFLLASGVATATLVSMALPLSRSLVWNVSASVPTGLYIIRGKRSLQAGERVAVAPPPHLQRLIIQRGYLPAKVPLIKRVAAVSGQRVCRFAHGVTIDGAFVGVARARDRKGRLLPAWFGCRSLRTGELFLMNPAVPDSFDGRYFGFLGITDVIGRATPLWTNEVANRHRVWFADPRAFEASTTTNQGD